MASLQKKLRDANDKRVLKQMFGKEPKHRCPVCHRFSLFNHTDPKLKEHNGCLMCHLIDETRKERANENGEGESTEPTDSGE